MSGYLCPVCRAPRRILLTDHISPAMHLKIGSGVAFVASIAFLASGFELAWRISFAYLPIWAIAEFVHWVKMREATKCEVCGFDPILYQKDWVAARKKVEDRLTVMVEEIKKKAQPQSEAKLHPVKVPGVAGETATGPIPKP